MRIFINSGDENFLELVKNEIRRKNSYVGEIEINVTKTIFLEIDIEIIIIDELAGKRPETKNKIICKSNNKNNIIQLSYNGSNHYKYYY